LGSSIKILGKHTGERVRKRESELLLMKDARDLEREEAELEKKHQNKEDLR